MLDRTISLQGRYLWHGRGHFMDKDDSCNSTLAIYMNYLSQLSCLGIKEETLQVHAAPCLHLLGGTPEPVPRRLIQSAAVHNLE